MQKNTVEILYCSCAGIGMKRKRKRASLELLKGLRTFVTENFSWSLHSITLEKYQIDVSYLKSLRISLEKYVSSEK